jgi:hypothetical protein
MPIWRGTIEKSFQNEFWVNVYHIDALDRAAATSICTQIMNIERVMHFDNIAFTKLRVDDMTPNTQNYQTTPVNLMGQNGTPTPSVMAPLFCTIRVDFAVDGQRPSRKYYRGCLAEANMNVLTLEGAQVAAFNTNIANPLAALAGFVDESGNAIISGSTYPNVQMRQLRRGSKKKSTPSSALPA